MTRVGNVDHVLLLLREQLQRMDKTRGARASRSGRGAEATLSPMARLRGVAAFDDLPEEEFRRTLLRAVLSEELGDEMASEPSFQAVVDDVFRILGESEQGRDLLAAAAGQLRGAQKRG